MPRDEASVVSLELDACEPKTVSTLSAAKLSQLEAARQKSLQVRRKRQADRLQSKLNHIRFQLGGGDMRPEQLERVCREMLALETSSHAEVVRLREKQNTMMSDIREVISGFRDEMRVVRKQLGIKPPTQSASINTTAPKHSVSTLSDIRRAGSEVSTSTNNSTTRRK